MSPDVAHIYTRVVAGAAILANTFQRWKQQQHTPSSTAINSQLAAATQGK